MNLDDKISKAKIRLLYLEKMFREQTDEQNALSTTDLMENLNRYGLSCDRKSLYSDIASLVEFGYDIIKVTKPKKGYALVSRDFELPEVRLLMDAVQSAGFITQKKTQQLISKLRCLTSQYQADSIDAKLYIDNRVKCKNEEIYYIIDYLNQAITQKLQATFKYARRKIDNINGPYIEEKEFVVSPYAMIWVNDHYYLVCNNQKYDNLMNLRVDRIHGLAVTQTPSRHFSEVSPYTDFFDAADYVSKHFNMFSGDMQEVELICDFSILEEIIDRFGDKVNLRIFDSTHFLAQVEAAVSDGLISWIMQYGNLLKIKSPELLKTMYIEKIKIIMEMY